MKKFLLFIVVAGLVAYFIWPTQYKEYKGGEGPFADQAGPAATRVHRITGEVWVIGASGEWTPLAVRRPELLRPDITGPQPNTQADTRPAQRQMQDTKTMQATTDEMTRAATEKAKPPGQ